MTADCNGQFGFTAADNFKSGFCIPNSKEWVLVSIAINYAERHVMDLSCSITNETQIITVKTARIDAAVAIQFKDSMRLVSEGGPSRIVLNLGNVDFIDSSGLGAIVAAMKQLDEGRKLDLCALTPNVDKVFRLTRMDTIFGIYDSVEDAVAGRIG